MESVKLQDGLLRYREYMKERGPYAGHCSLIAGLPHETLETLRETKRWYRDYWGSTEHSVGNSATMNPLWIPDVARPFEEQSRFAMAPAKYGYLRTTIDESNGNNAPWVDGDQKRFRGLYEELIRREEAGISRTLKSKESRFEEEMAFMNWKNDNMNLYQAIDFLEHEWYTDEPCITRQPPLVFGYHNWLIDPSYTWEDMMNPQSELPLPKELAAGFITNYIKKKLNQ